MKKNTKNIHIQNDNTIVVSLDDPRWEQNIDHIERTVQDLFQLVLKIADCKLENCQACISLSHDAEIKELNFTYRHKDYATNVLAFPFDQNLGGELPFNILGDIIIAYETIYREAQEQNKSLVDHFSHMVIHGTLHLLGYDHMSDLEAEVMEALEVKILQELGIMNPYEVHNMLSE